MAARRSGGTGVAVPSRGAIQALFTFLPRVAGRWSRVAGHKDRLSDETAQNRHKAEHARLPCALRLVIGPRRLLGSGGPDRRELELESDLLADQDAAGLE